MATMPSPPPSRLLSPRATKIWSRIHKWTSLVATAFLLVLCLTGLPLVFHDEIDHWLGVDVVAPQMPAATPRLSADRIIEVAREHVPGKFVRFLIADDEEPIWYVTFVDAPMSKDVRAIVSLDARTGEVLRTGKTFGGAFTAFVLKLHKDLFAEDIGSWLLCGIGLVFLLSIVSGVVVYAPFMRRLAFGSVRGAQGPRLKWLDLHNLAGIVLTLWLVVVGFTGVINTLSGQIARHWQRTELVEMIGRWRNLPPPAHPVGPQQAIDAAMKVAPGMELRTIAVPGNPFAGPHHYALFFRGATPLTKRILKPVLIDAETGAFADTREFPLYAKALFVSQPLHFGDYGGMPLKIVWALLDVVTIVVLGSGLYLWLARRRKGVASYDPEIVQEALAQQAAE